MLHQKYLQDLRTDINNDMRNTTKQIMQGNRNRKLTLMVQIAGLIIVFANVWIIAKLSPITEDIATITTKVEAIETLDKTFIGRSEIEVQLKAINKSLDSINRILQIHLIK